MSITELESFSIAKYENNPNALSTDGWIHKM